jgi:glycosyltransferase involved in cell wall biosynthesis
VLQENKIDYKFQSFLDEKTWNVLYKQGFAIQKSLGIIKGFFRRIEMLFFLNKYDKVFIHREVAPIGPPIFEWIISKMLSKKIIYDFDDAIWLENTSSENSIASKLKWHSKVGSICKWSKTVSTGNKYLADYSKIFNSNVIVNPTTISTNNLHLPRYFKNDKPVIGWTGTHSTAKYLKKLLEPLRELSGQFEFIYISNKEPDFELPNLEFIKWNKESEITDLNRVDIGIMPLENDEWAKGKCGFKALQYMALEIPALVSPVGVNEEIVDHGINGFHCNTSNDWKERIIELIENPALRVKMGKEGRKKVIDKYSVESNTENFLSILKS